MGGGGKNQKPRWNLDLIQIEIQWESLSKLELARHSCRKKSRQWQLSMLLHSEGKQRESVQKLPEVDGEVHRLCSNFGDYFS